jgi:hypothetical protein
MRGGGILLRQQTIQAPLGLGERLLHAVARTRQARRADRNQERGDGLESSPQVVETGRDQVTTREVRRFERLLDRPAVREKNAALRGGG